MISTKHILNKLKNQIKNSDFTNKAAVLIPIIADSDGNLNLLFELRSSRLKWQPGDICFPGGRMDALDHSPIDTAIRETFEEIGIAKEQINVYGELPSFLSNFGVTIYPIVGELISTEFNLNHDEVADTFCVPIDWFINNPPIISVIEVAHKPADNFPFDLLPKKSQDWQKRSQHDVYIYDYQGYIIWGLTAQIVQQFLTTIA